ncbi:conjugal transfer protein [Bacillus cereus]|uniref:conjugal transfer protein n=1 Tax=Bacillus cereus TaxID=1396 RepID=UPI001ABFB3A7|nr:conjugal transfer protein [Bacillus cereus]
MGLFQKVREIKGKTAVYIAENKPHKRPKESRKLPLVKKMGFWKVVIWSTILVISMSGMLALLRAQNALGKSKQAEAAVNQMKEENAMPKQAAYQSPKLEVYASRFIDIYMNIPKENREKRLEELSTWYAKGVKMEDTKNVTGYRKVKGKTLYDITVHKDYVVMQYKVVYDNVTIEKIEEPQPHLDPAQPPPPPKVVENEKPSEHTVIVNVPVASKNGKYAIIEHPYTTSAEQLQSQEIETVQNELEKKEQVPFTEKQKIETWLKEFFVKYAENKPEDMSYMMKEPKALSGVKSFVTVSDVKVYPVEQKKTWMVKGSVVFREKEIEFEQKESFTMKIMFKEGKYTVEQMTHTIGGMK